jgi:hypothetical protein
LFLASIRRSCIRVLFRPYFFLLNKMRRSSPAFFEKKMGATSEVVGRRAGIDPWILVR